MTSKQIEAVVRHAEFENLKMKISGLVMCLFGVWFIGHHAYEWASGKWDSFINPSPPDNAEVFSELIRTGKAHPVETNELCIVYQVKTPDGIAFLGNPSVSFWSWNWKTTPDPVPIP